MLDRIYKFVQTVSNNEKNGNIKPQEFRLLVNNSVEELYEETIHELKDEIRNERRYGKNYSIENITGKLRDKVFHYYFSKEAIKANGAYPLPDDLRYLDTVEFNGTEVEMMENSKQFKIVSSCIDTAPKLTTPIGFQINSSIEIAPETIVDPIAVYYLRKPKSANWTYSKIPIPEQPGQFAEAFDPDAPGYQDADIHPSEEFNLSIRILQKVGINLQENQLAQYGLTKEGNNFQKENAS